MVSGISRILICWVLVFQIGFSYPLSALANSTPATADEALPTFSKFLLGLKNDTPVSPEVESIASESSNFQQAIQHSRETTLPPATLDHFWYTKQYRRIYGTRRVTLVGGHIYEVSDIVQGRVVATRQVDDREESIQEIPGQNDQEVVIREIHLANIDTSNERVEILNPNRELRFFYNADAREFVIRQIVQENGRERIANEHVFKDVVLSGDPETLNKDLNSDVAKDANMVLFPTAEGIRGLFWFELKDRIFSSPIIAPLMLERPPLARANIERIEYLHPGREPRTLVRTDLTALGIYEDGDLAVTVSHPVLENRTRTVVHIPRAELITKMGLNLLVDLSFMQIANPDMQSAEVVQRVLRERASDLERFYNENPSASLEQTSEVVGSRGADLVRWALVNRAQNTDFGTLAQNFSRNGEGVDSFGALATAARDTRSADASPGGQWQRTYDHIIAEINKDQAAGRTVRTWKQVVTENYLESQGLIEQSAIVHERAERQVQLNFFGRIKDRVQQWATPQRMKRTAYVVGGAVGLWAVNRLADGVPAAWAASTLSHALSWATRVPVFRVLAVPVSRSIGYFANTWSWVRWGAGLGIALAIGPVSSALAGAVARMKGKSWTSFQAFFSWGTQLAARASYLLHKVFWEGLASQKLLYNRALANNVDPLENSDVVFHAPDASDEEIARLGRELDNRIDENALRRTRAMLMAAAVVSEKENIDIASLFMVAQGKQLSEFNNMMTNVSDLSSWSRLMQAIYKALVQMGDEGIGSVSGEAVIEYHSLFERFAQEYQQLKQRTPMALAVQALDSLRERSKTFMSRNILSTILFQKNGYQFARKYRSVVLDANSADIAGRQYRVDYPMSAIYYGLTDAIKFGDVATMGRGGPEVLANQLGQPMIYAATSGIDVKSTAGSLGLVNPYEPMTDRIYVKAKPHMGEERISGSRVREQNFREGMRILVRNSVDPNTPSYFANHAQYIRNTVNNFQGRWLTGAPIRFLGLWLSDYATSGHLNLSGSGLMSLTYRAAMIEAFWWIMKYSVMGYAWVWPFVTRATQYLEGEASANRVAIQGATFLIENGIGDINRSGSAVRLQRGVTMLQGLFEHGGVELPAELAVTADQHTPESARALLRYTWEHMPVPTEASRKVDNVLLNMGIGSIISTVLFLGNSAAAYNRDANPMQLLAKAVLLTSGTFVALKVLQPVSRAVLRAGHNVVNRVRSFFRRVFGSSKNDSCKENLLPPGQGGGGQVQ